MVIFHAKDEEKIPSQGSTHDYRHGLQLFHSHILGNMWGGLSRGQMGFCLDGWKVLSNCHVAEHSCVGPSFLPTQVNQWRKMLLSVVTFWTNDNSTDPAFKDWNPNTQTFYLFLEEEGGPSMPKGIRNFKASLLFLIAVILNSVCFNLPLRKLGYPQLSPKWGFPSVSLYDVWAWVWMYMSKKICTVYPKRLRTPSVSSYEIFGRTSSM